MRDSQFHHLATKIHRPSHAVAGQKKTTGATVVAKNVPCRLTAITDAATNSIMGLDAVETYRIQWPGDTDVLRNDIAEVDGAFYVITGRHERWLREGDIASHIETFAQLSKRSAA